MSAPTAERPRMDPRIATRRRAVEEASVMRRRQIVAAVLVVVVVVMGLVGLTRSPLLDIDRISVRGVGASAESRSVIDASGLERGDAMVDLDNAAVVGRVEALPWVDSAVVGRDWPATVTVTVEPRVVVASVAPSGGVEEGRHWMLVDGDGVVTAVVSKRPARVPEIRGAPTGPTTPGEVVGRSVGAAVAAADALPASLVPTVDHLEVTDRGVDLLMGPAGAVRVKLGRPESAPAAYRALAALLAAGELDCAASVDLEVPDRPLLTRDPECP